MADLEEAINVERQALAVTPEHHPQWIQTLNNLRSLLEDRYSKTDAIADHEEMIKVERQAVAATKDHPDGAVYLDNLSDLLEHRYFRTESKADLEEAIKIQRQVFATMSEDDPDRVRRLNIISTLLESHYLGTDAMADLEEIIKIEREIVTITPEDDPNRVTYLFNLGISLEGRFSRTESMVDLDEAIEVIRQAVASTLEGDPDQASGLSSLGMLLCNQFFKTEVMADLDDAINVKRQAVATTVGGGPDLVERLANLGLSLTDRYVRTAASNDLEEAIQVGEQSIAIPAKDHLNKASQHKNLGDRYHMKYQAKGLDTDLERAIQHFQESLNLIPKTHPERADRLQNLGAVYRDFYLEKNAETDLDIAIRYFQEALDAMSKDSPERQRRLRYLGFAYQDRYLRKGSAIALDSVIQQFQEALNLTPEGHPERFSQFHSLGIGYHIKYQAKGLEIDLNMAIQQYQESLKLTTKDNQERVGQLQNLGAAYWDLYQRNRVEADLDAAIQYSQEALQLTPEDHPQRANRLQALGTGYYDKYRRKGIEIDLHNAIEQYKKSLDHHPSPTRHRLRSGIPLIKLYAEAKNWSLAHQIASTSVSLIARLTPRSLQTSDKQNLLIEVVGLASDSAATALMAEKLPYEAIRLLELGRGVIMASLNEMRADISDLQQKHPQLAEDFMSLQNQLDAPTTLTRQADEPYELAVFANPVNQRHNAGRKLEQIIENIRRLSGFERFLLAPTENELKAAAASGPVVVINVSDYRCDALIIEKCGFQSIRLLHLHNRDIRARAVTLVNPDTQLLEWLWDTIAKPVLDALGFTQTPSNSWPRIWWIPTGLLTKFPIHAAGYPGSSNAVLDRVISSYSSSIRALMQGHQRPSQAMPNKSGKAVLVGMESTPGQEGLRYVPGEIAKLSCLCRSMQLDVTTPQTRQDDVLSALRDCRIFHFAGHGLTHPSDPSKSSLILSDGPLTVASLFELNLHNRAPFLAYLSACGTGEVKHDNLIDEALHLINACQLAGFRHVIGTLWKVNDQSCVEAATMSYEWMKRGTMSDDSVAEGLHRASRHLRSQWNSENAAHTSKRMAAVRAERNPAATEQPHSSQATTRDPRTAELYEDPPIYWVPYVHFGI